MKSNPPFSAIIFLQKYGNVSLDELIGNYLDGIQEPTEYTAPVGKILNSVASDLGWKAFNSKR